MDIPEQEHRKENLTNKLGLSEHLLLRLCHPP